MKTSREIDRGCYIEVINQKLMSTQLVTGWLLAPRPSGVRFNLEKVLSDSRMPSLKRLKCQQTGHAICMASWACPLMYILKLLIVNLPEPGLLPCIRGWINRILSSTLSDSPARVRSYSFSVHGFIALYQVLKEAIVPDVKSILNTHWQVIIYCKVLLHCTAFVTCHCMSG